MARFWGLVLWCLGSVAAADVPSASLASVGGGAAGASLFAGPDRGLFAPVLPRAVPEALAVPDSLTVPETDPVARLRDLIARAEAGPAGYDAVQHGARIRPARAPTDMTVGEIYAWIKATPRQPHAIGRYQFIPATLRRLVRDLGVDVTARFDADLQNKLADRLLVEAGLLEFTGGRLERRAFMRNLAKVWAGLPLPNGRSYYQGYAGNKAVISWAEFDQGMAEIFAVGGV